jgi:hypothetical protein
MLGAKSIAEGFVTHVRGREPGHLACSIGTAVESWFQVELGQMLLDSGSFDSIQFSYDYPDGRGKADLAASKANSLVVFELKCFVN